VLELQPAGVVFELPGYRKQRSTDGVECDERYLD
jgi:hypothetical protein